MSGTWVEPDTRDAVVDYIHYWQQRSSLPQNFFLQHIRLRHNKFNSWQQRYGKENFHNGKIPRDFWLEEWEKERIIEFYRENSCEGYRRIAYMILDRGDD